MRILIFSDFHLHNWTYGSTLVDGMNSRLKAQAAVFDQIALDVQRSQVDSVVFCGDLFHTHSKIDAAVLKVAWQGFSRILENNVYVDVLVGNHDTGDKTSAAHSLDWLKAFNFGHEDGLIRVIDKKLHNAHYVLIRVIDKKLHNAHYVPQWQDDFSFLPYTEDKEVIKKFFEECGEVCFMHQGVATVPMGSGFLIDEILTPDMIPDHVKHVFTGHYHQHNRVSDKLTIVGSTMQHTWADEGDPRGWVIYDTDTGEITHVRSTAPEFVTLDAGLELWNETPVQNNFIRVVNYNKSHTDTTRKLLMGAGARSVEFVAETEPGTVMFTPNYPAAFHLPKLVEEYEKRKKVSKACSKVGKEIMR